MEFEPSGIVSGMMEIASPVITGLVLIAAGPYQLTPLKRVCLKHCQNPLTFIIQRWRPGKAGAFRMGLEHGRYCLGCCWFLMVLLSRRGHRQPHLDSWHRLICGHREVCRRTSLAHNRYRGDTDDSRTSNARKPTSRRMTIKAQSRAPNRSWPQQAHLPLSYLATSSTCAR